VEFALVLPLLFVILFGIIEFGYGLFQVQAAQAAVREAARSVALGVDGCGDVQALVTQAVQNNALGVDPATVTYTLRITPAPDTSALRPQRGESAVLTLQYEPSLDFPLVPFPDSITRQSGVTLEDVGDNMVRLCP
jgi:hypothetical protein